LRGNVDTAVSCADWHSGGLANSEPSATARHLQVLAYNLNFPGIREVEPDVSSDLRIGENIPSCVGYPNFIPGACLCIANVIYNCNAIVLRGKREDQQWRNPAR
jgi:hypothetical protein